MQTNKTKFALILSLLITCQYFTLAAPASPIVALEERAADSDSQDASGSNNKGAKPSETSKTAREIDRWQVAKSRLEDLTDMKLAEIAEAFGIPEGKKRATYGIVYLGCVIR